MLTTLVLLVTPPGWTRTAQHPFVRLAAARTTCSAHATAQLVSRYAFEHLVVRTGEGAGELVPTQEISLHDITPDIEAMVRRLGVVDGTVNVISQHTTTAVTINEYESRLIDDVREFLQKLAPPEHAYKHNDLHLRPASPADYARIDRNWISQGKGTLAEFMAQEPINAHAHLCAMVLGPSQTIPIANGKLCIGQWQSIILVDLDGPRERKVGIQVSGIGSAE